MLPAEVEGDGRQQRSGPPVHRVERVGLVIADEVRDQPDDEPDEGHGRASLRIVASEPG